MNKYPFDLVKFLVLEAIGALFLLAIAFVMFLFKKETGDFIVGFLIANAIVNAVSSLEKKQ